VTPSLLIFDLDGTLIDSERDLIVSVNAARAHMGLDELHDDTVRSYVGDGAPTLIRRAMGPDSPQQDVDRALAFFLDYYRAHMLDHTTVYPGVPETLDHLKARQIPMAVLTNKPVRFSQELVRALGLSHHFVNVYGGNSFEEKKPHPMGVDRLLDETGATREDAWMIGDSATDILTARNARIRSVGVTYGFKPESLADTPPDILIDTFPALQQIWNGRA
jgi:phosphoglycolate phosphatase